MYFFNDGLVQYILEVFRAKDFKHAADGDSFFQVFAPGNMPDFAERPFERFSDYEELLLRLMQADPIKYRKVHKGTPFGFMSWLAFDLRNYEKALFYLDAAISEDVRKADPPETWISNPGPKVLILDADPANIWFRRSVDNMKRLLEQELTRFNGISNRPPLDIRSWQSFVRNLIGDPTKRTIISAIYVFLLEFEDRRQELQLREGSTGGSNRPFTVHLFTGGLLFESLLKHYYPTNDQGKKNETLGDVFAKKTGFSADFGAGCAGVERTAKSLADIHVAIQDSTSMETAFSTAAKLRNTTGHDLVWDDIFSTPAKYVDLFQQVMNAILHVISRKLV